MKSMIISALVAAIVGGLVAVVALKHMHEDATDSRRNWSCNSEGQCWRTGKCETAGNSDGKCTLNHMAYCNETSCWLDVASCEQVQHMARRVSPCMGVE